jgi:HepT-like protein
MISVFLDVKNELAEIKKEFDVMKKKAELLKKTKDPDVRDSHIRAIAGCVHGIYTGVEVVLKGLVKYFDGEVPSGEDWHIQLLLRCKNPNEGVRPAILSDDTFTLLDDLRGFRHVFRGKYHTNLNPGKVLERMKATVAMVPKLTGDLRAFRSEVEKQHDASPDKSPISVKTTRTR